MTCSICQYKTLRNYYQPDLMGRVPGVFCWYCFLAWYECGMITEDSIRTESIRSREDPDMLKERAA